MAASSKRQTTMAKIAREQALREKRVEKQRRKDERVAARAAGVPEATDEQTIEDGAAEDDGDLAADGSTEERAA